MAAVEFPRQLLNVTPPRCIQTRPTCYLTSLTLNSARFVHLIIPTFLLIFCRRRVRSTGVELRSDPQRALCIQNTGRMAQWAARFHHRWRGWQVQVNFVQALDLLGQVGLDWTNAFPDEPLSAKICLRWSVDEVQKDDPFADTGEIVDEIFEFEAVWYGNGVCYAKFVGYDGRLRR